MLDWEYMVIRARNRTREEGTIGGQQVEHAWDHENVLNALGAEGWELVTAQPGDDAAFYVKRPRVRAE